MKHTRVSNAADTELYAQTDIEYHDVVFPRYVLTEVMEDDSEFRDEFRDAHKIITFRAVEKRTGSQDKGKEQGHNLKY